MISEIFRVKRQSASKNSYNLEIQEDEIDVSPNDKFQRLLKYPGIFDKNASTLYMSIRNLYSLSMRQEILQIIAKIANYSIYKERNKNKTETDEDKDDKEFVLTDYEKRGFELAIN
jgi:hypothetical protein